MISNLAVGYDNIDVAAATRCGVLVAHTPGVLAETTADFALALMLAAARRVIDGAQYVRAGRWRTWGPELLLGRDLWGATLGIVGMGQVGQAVARRAAGFGMRILYYTPRRRLEDEREGGPAYASLDQLLAESDIVSLHCPANTETRGLMNGQSFARMREGALLINTARGAVVDLDACFQALKSGRLGGAGLDVLSSEPPPADHPLIRAYAAQEDWLRDRLILTPHAAWYAPESWQDMRRLAVERLIAYLRHGEDSCVVNKAFLRPR